MQDPNSAFIRNKPRQPSERRQQSRRRITSPFGSDEWVRTIRDSYAFWPKHDRRRDERRSERRRIHEQSMGLRRYQRFPLKQSAHIKPKHEHARLSAEEVQMLRDLNEG
jgi:hypothetical protein